MARKPDGYVFPRNRDGRIYKWYFKWHGKQIPLGPGTWDRSEAEKAKQRWLEQHGHLQSELLDNKLVNEFVEKYLIACKSSVCDKSYKNKRTAMTKFSEKFGTVVVSDLCHVQVEDWAKSVPTWGEGGRRRCLTDIKGAFTYFVRRKRLKANPLADLSVGQTKYRKADVVISDDTHVKIMKVAPEWIRDILAVLYATGARPNEILRATAAEYVPGSAKLCPVQHKTAYKGKDRTIVIPAEVRDIFARLVVKHPEGYLFRGPSGGTVHSSYLCQRMKELAKEGGVDPKIADKLICYGYRHAYAVGMLRVTGSAARTAGHMGHTSTKLVEGCYGHLVAEAQQDEEARILLREMRQQSQE